MIIFGKWVSNYLHQDKVIFLLNSYQIKEGRIYLPNNHYTEDFTIYSDNLPYKREDILVLSNIQNNNHYSEHPELLIECYVNNLKTRLKQAECQHNWVGKSENQKCSKCHKRD